MSNVLFLRGFNNYHKRTIIKFSTLTEYQDNSASFLNFADIKFNNNDGITTELIVGNASQLENAKILAFDEVGSPDYLVVYETDSDNNIVIKSRWFILESVKTTAGQYRLALKRDVIADHMDWILNADCFIEKAQIMDIYSPYIFNNESMTYNQIKKREVPLYDSTGVPWIVGYVAKNYNGDNGNDETVNGKAINVDNISAYDDIDLPFGTLTSAIINTGLQYNTVDSLNLFVKIKGLYGANNSINWYAYMTGRSRIEVWDSNVHSIDNNYGLFYLALSGDTLASRKNITGTGLGDFTDTTISVTNHANLFLATSSYPRGSQLQAIQPVMDELMGRTISGKSVAKAIVDEISAYDLIDFDWVGGDVMKYDGEQVRIDDGNGGYNYYTMQIRPKGTIAGRDLSTYLSSGTKSAIIAEMNDALNDLDKITWTSDNELQVFVETRSYEVKFIAVPPTLSIETKLNAIDNRWGCNDQLFDIFCIPYGKLHVNDDIVPGGTVQSFYTNPQAGLAAARAMAQKLGSNLYDLQILPYCPIKEIRNWFTVYVTGDQWANNVPHLVDPYIYRSGAIIIDSDDSTINGFYERIYDQYDSSIVYNYVFWATESHGTFDVPILSSDDKYYQYDMPVNNKIIAKKVSNETEVFRLCSPNYNGIFEYSPSKNNNVETRQNVNIAYSIDGVDYYLRYSQPKLSYINVDYTYRPGNPYIHLNPIFRGEDQGAIYGKDFNDVRGLICGGDFSLGYIVDAYRQYQIQNANFQNIFDRQLQNLDYNNAIAKEQTQFASMMSAIGLPLGGATTGALVGAKSGGGVYGALAGAAVGATGGLIGGVAGYQLNMDWLERMQQETRAYSIDMYNYNLGNIKALPYSISRTDCLAENTRLVPFLEVYQATNAEVENLKNVLKYNGMTVMTIDKPINYIASDDISAHWENAIQCHDKACYYIKAKLIMNTENELADDFHIVDAIYAELDKGVYIQGYEEE